MHVEEHDVDALVPEKLLGELDRRRFEHAVSLELEVDTAEHSQAVVVVDDKHRVSGSPHGRSHCSAEPSLWSGRADTAARPLNRAGSSTPKRTETNVSAVRSRCETCRREWAA